MRVSELWFPWSQDSRASPSASQPHAPLWLLSHLRAQGFFSVVYTSRTFTSSWWFCLLSLHVFGKHQVQTVVFFCPLNARTPWLGWTQMMVVSLTTKVPLSGQLCADPLCFFRETVPLPGGPLAKVQALVKVLVGWPRDQKPQHWLGDC